MNHVSMIAWGAVFSCLTFGLACENKKDSSSEDGAQNDTMTPATGGTSSSPEGEPEVSFPAITEAPPAWIRPTECGGVGDTCPEGIFGCQAPTSSCQLIGNVCIPQPPEGELLPGPDEEHPYCAASICMTFDQASCFCTGEAGAEESACLSPAALAGLCGTDYTSCDPGDTPCCEGFACLPDRYYPSHYCREVCEDDSDCASGCCADSLDTGQKICSDTSFCETACLTLGTTNCESPDPQNVPSPCCRGDCVSSEHPDFAGCRPRCDTNDDCFETGCCQLYSDSTRGFCVDARYCSCLSADSPCGGYEPPCCDGLECVSYGGDDFRCYPK